MSESTSKRERAIRQAHEDAARAITWAFQQAITAKHGEPEVEALTKSADMILRRKLKEQE